MTPDQVQTAMKNAICGALHNDGQSGYSSTYGPDGPTNQTADAIYAAITSHMLQMAPEVLRTAAQDPIVAEQVGSALVTPVMQELEDTINDRHDSATTADTYRPGLRMAARMIRDIRREAQETP